MTVGNRRPERRVRPVPRQEARQTVERPDSAAFTDKRRLRGWMASEDISAKVQLERQREP
jgi:hypothetical protein